MNCTVYCVSDVEGLLSSRGGGGGAQTYWHQAYKAQSNRQESPNGSKAGSEVEIS